MGLKVLALGALRPTALQELWDSETCANKSWTPFGFCVFSCLFVASLRGLSHAAQFYNFRMRQDNVRIALQGIEIMVSKTGAGFRSDKQRVCLGYQSLNMPRRERFFSVERFIDRHDKLR